MDFWRIVLLVVAAVVAVVLDPMSLMVVVADLTSLAYLCIHNSNPHRSDVVQPWSAAFHASLMCVVVDLILYHNESIVNSVYIYILPLSDDPSISVDVLEFLRRAVVVVVVVTVCKEDERARDVSRALGIGGGGANPPLCVV